MPYFKCERCALTWYSAASETRCDECAAPLRLDERAFDATPLARPRGSLRPIGSLPQPLLHDRRLA
jgi:hypothetical protein